MPIKAKIREAMRRLKTSRFVIRFWIKSEVYESYSEAIDNRLAEFGRAVECQSTTLLPAGVELLAVNFFREDDGIAAMEVLSAATHNGLVSYYDWP